MATYKEENNFKMDILPYYVTPRRVQIDNVHTCNCSVKLQCVIPKALLNMLCENPFFNINGYKAYIGHIYDDKSEIVAVDFILKDLFPFEEAKIRFKLDTIIKIDSLEKYSENKSSLDKTEKEDDQFFMYEPSQEDIRTISDVTLRITKVMETVINTVQSNIALGEYDELIRKFLVDTFNNIKK